MRARTFSLSFFIASAAAAIAWLTLLPVVLGLLEVLRATTTPGSPEALRVAEIRAVLPFYLAADLILILGVCFLILYVTLGRPLAQTEAAIEQLQKLQLDLPALPGGGPILSRVRTSVRRLAAALTEEQALTRRQVQDLKDANARLQATRAELVASERLATVGRLAAGVAHEIGNPLSGILGYLSLLRSRTADAQQVEFVDRLEAEVQRINQIVRGLLDLGRPRELALAALEVAPLIRTCARLLRASPELKNVTVDIQVPDGIVARADPGPLSQVLLNLVLNAAQAMRGSGRVTVSGAEEGENVVVRVEDDGPGIPPELREQIFEPFFTTKASAEGTGLGLAVSLHLVKSMNGDLRVDASPFGGACFIITLPRP